MISLIRLYKFFLSFSYVVLMNFGCATLDEVEMESVFNKNSLQIELISVATPVDLREKNFNISAVHPSLLSTLGAKEWSDNDLDNVHKLWTQIAAKRGFKLANQIELNTEELDSFSFKFKSELPIQTRDALRAKTKARYLALLLITAEDLYNQQDKSDDDGSAKIKYAIVSGRKIWTKMLMIDLQFSRVVFEARDSEDRSERSTWSESKTIDGGIFDNLFFKKNQYPQFPTRLGTIEPSLQDYVDSWPF